MKYCIHVPAVHHPLRVLYLSEGIAVDAGIIVLGRISAACTNTIPISSVLIVVIFLADYSLNTFTVPGIHSCIHQFFNVISYIIGGRVYTLNDIESGVLRSNRKPVGAFKRPFSKDDPRCSIIDCVMNTYLAYSSLVTCT